MLKSGRRWFIESRGRFGSSPYLSMDYEANNEEKAKFFYDERSGRYHCCCGLLHVVNGTKMFLMFYIVLSVALLILGIPAAFVWMVLPFIITLLSVYALCTEKHRYLYPFLILSGIHVVVFILMALMVIAFTAANYPTLKQIIDHSLMTSPSDTYIVVVVTSLVISLLSLSVIHLWQMTVIYGCMLFMEMKQNALICSNMLLLNRNHYVNPPPVRANGNIFCRQQRIPSVDCKHSLLRRYFFYTISLGNRNF